MDSWTHNYVKLKTGHTYHYVDQKPDPAGANGDTMICLHGFPDQWFGWRNQIEPWARAGYRVIVPSMLGYGGSDKPNDYKQYSAKPLYADIAALLDSVFVEQAVVVAHDWGAAIAWRFALWNPKRIKALISLSVPYFPPNKRYISPDEAARKVPSFGYQVYFNDPHSSKEIDEHLDLFLRTVFRAPLKATPTFKVGQMQSVVLGKTPLHPTPLIIDDKEFEDYKHEFTKGGMHGPLCYYRNALTRYEEENDGQVSLEFPQALPVLLMFGTKDPTCPSSYVERMPMLVKNLSVVALLDKGHWVLVEAKDEVTNAVLRWLDSSTTGERAKL